MDCQDTLEKDDRDTASIPASILKRSIDLLQGEQEDNILQYYLSRMKISLTCLQRWKENVKIIFHQSILRKKLV